MAGRDVGAGRGPGPLRRRRPPIRLATRLALYLTVAGVCGAVLFPVYWMVLTSLRQTRDTITYPPDLLPRNVRLSAYGELLQTVPIATWLGNTVVISIGVMLLCLVLSVLGAYALSHFRWRGRSAFGFLLLVTQMLPEALLVIPIFVIFRRAGLIDTQPGLILADAAFVVPVGVWILKSYMDTIPREVREAALIDGCGPMGTLWRITLPLSVPALITVGVIAFFDGWNEYLFASTFITSSDLRPASVGLASFIGELATPVELVFAATALFTTPPVVFYFLMQRYFVSGLTSGAIKG
jgi:multiple sugar transport system permease protein